ncbi:MAG: serine kinase [Ignavibacteria bacterium]
MKLADIINKLELEKLTEINNPDCEVSGGYISDLLSDVMANSAKDNIWVTVQTHLNIAAVAKLKELAAIIIVMNKEVDAETISKANLEKINILRTKMNSFLVGGKLYEMGIR